MTKKTYPVDLSIPVFPFGQEYHPDKAEPGMEAGRLAVPPKLTPLDIQNVLPTPLGYASFFGSNDLGLPNLPEGTERIFTYLDAAGNNFIIALGMYGAYVSRDGITWDITEGLALPTGQLQGLVRNSVSAAILTVTHHQPLAMPPADTVLANHNFASQRLGYDSSYFLASGALHPLGMPLNSTLPLYIAYAPVNNGYYAPKRIDMPYDSAYTPTTSYAYTRDTHTIDLAGMTVVAGHTYQLTNYYSDALYTAQAGDTATQLRDGLLANLLGNQASGTVKADGATRIQVHEASPYSSARKVSLFDLTAAQAAVGTLVGTLDGSAVSLKRRVLDLSAHRGKVCYAVFSYVGAGTPSRYESFQFAMDYVELGDSLSYFYPLSNGLGTKVFFPCLGYQFEAAKYSVALGWKVDIYATNVATLMPFSFWDRNTMTCLGWSSSKVQPNEKLHCINLAGSATVTVPATTLANTLYNTTTLKTQMVTALNTAIPTLNAKNLLDLAPTSASFMVFDAQPSPVYVLPSPSASNHTLSWHNGVNTFDGVNGLADWAVQDSVIAGNSITALRFSGTANLVPTDVYALISGGEPCPITDPLGIWTDANYHFTGAQINAAITAGTTLFTHCRDSATYLFRFGNSGVAHPVTVTLSNISGSAHGMDYMGHAENFYIDYPAGGTILSVGGDKGGTLQKLLQTFTGTANDWWRMGHRFTTPGATTDYLTRLGVTNFQQDPTPASTVSDWVSLTLQPAGTNLEAFVDVVPGAWTAKMPDTYAMTFPYNAGAVATFTPNYQSVNRLYISTTATIPTVNSWSYAVLKNTLYCYRQGLGYVLTLDLATGAWAHLTPTFINLAQMQGICAARGRMMAWDSTNSVYTSSALDPMDFTPSLKTRANVTKVDALVGNIVSVLPMEEGFVIYATGSIVLAKYVGGTTTYSYKLLTDREGVLNALAVTVGDPQTHFAYTGERLIEVSARGVRAISNELSAYAKQSLVTPRLDFLEGKYLAISLTPTTANNVRQHEVIYLGRSLQYGMGGNPPADPIRNPSFNMADATGWWDINYTVLAPLTLNNTYKYNYSLWNTAANPTGTPPGLEVQAGLTYTPYVGDMITPADYVAFNAQLLSDYIIPEGTTTSGVRVAVKDATYNSVHLKFDNQKLLEPYGSLRVAQLSRIDSFTLELLAGIADFAGKVLDTTVPDGVSTTYTGGKWKTLPNNAYGQPQGTTEPLDFTVTFQTYQFPWGTKLNTTYALASYSYVVTNFNDVQYFSDPVAAEAYWNKHYSVDGGSMQEMYNGEAIISLGYTYADPTTNTYYHYPYNLAYRPISGAYDQIRLANPGAAIQTTLVPPTQPTHIKFPDTEAAALAATRAIYYSELDAALANVVASNHLLYVPTVHTSQITLAFSVVNGLGVVTGAMKAHWTDGAGADHILVDKQFQGTGQPSSNSSSFQRTVTYSPPNAPDPNTVIGSLPGGSFVAQSGARQGFSPVYDRSLILDIDQKNWGSMDYPHRLLTSLQAVNARSLSPLGEQVTSYTYDNLKASLIGLGFSSGLSLQTNKNGMSVIEFGDFGVSETGKTRMLNAMAQFSRETGAVLEVIGSIDGNGLSSLLHISAASTNSVADLNKVLTAKWFRIRVKGQFNLTALSISAESGGKR